MLPRATPESRKSRQPAPLTPPSGRVSVFHDPVTTPKAIRMLKVTRTTRRSGNRSASTAVRGGVTVPTGPSPPLCSVMSTPGSDPRWASYPDLDSAEHRVGADGEVGLPIRALQVGPREPDDAPASHLDPVGVPLRHGQREREHAVVVPAAQGALSQGPAAELRGAKHRRGLVPHRHRHARTDV